MEYSRRNFMKAAGVGAVAVTTTMGTVGAVAAGATPAAKPLATGDSRGHDQGDQLVQYQREGLPG